MMLLPTHGLLRPGIFMAPLRALIRNRHIRLRLPTSLLSLRLLNSHLLSEIMDLSQNHLPHLPHVLNDFKVEIEGRGAGGLVGSVVPDVQVRVLKSGFDRDAGGGVEGQHFVEQVEGVRVGVGEEPGEGNFLHEGEIADVVLCAGGADAGEGFFVRRAEIM